MSDTERIAAYLARIEYINCPPTTTRRILADPIDQHVPGSLYDIIKGLAAMLSDVRRAEREACEAEVQNEIDAASHRQSGAVEHYWDICRSQVQALGWALKHIRERGTT